MKNVPNVPCARVHSSYFADNYKELDEILYIYGDESGKSPNEVTQPVQLNIGLWLYLSAGDVARCRYCRPGAALLRSAADPKVGIFNI